jgi:hypothetical protein
MKARQALNVLLALDDEHAPFQRESFHQAGQAVENAGDALESPDPAALTVGLPLAECFWSEPNNLEQQCSEFVGIVVTRDDLVLRICTAVASVAVAMLAQPFPRIADALASEKVEHTTAFAGLMVEPCALGHIDGAGAIAAPSQFLLARMARVRLAPEAPGDIRHGLGELGHVHAVAPHRIGSPLLRASQRASSTAVS